MRYNRIDWSTTFVDQYNSVRDFPRFADGTGGLSRLRHLAWLGSSRAARSASLPRQYQGKWNSKEAIEAPSNWTPTHAVQPWSTPCGGASDTSQTEESSIQQSPLLGCEDLIRFSVGGSEASVPTLWALVTERMYGTSLARAKPWEGWRSVPYVERGVSYYLSCISYYKCIAKIRGVVIQTRYDLKLYGRDVDTSPRRGSRRILDHANTKVGDACVYLYKL